MSPGILRFPVVDSRPLRKKLPWILVQALQQFGGASRGPAGTAGDDANRVNAQAFAGHARVVTSLGEEY